MAEATVGAVFSNTKEYVVEDLGCEAKPVKRRITVGRVAHCFFYLRRHLRRATSAQSWRINLGSHCAFPGAGHKVRYDPAAKAPAVSRVSGPIGGLFLGESAVQTVTSAAVRSSTRGAVDAVDAVDGWVSAVVTRAGDACTVVSRWMETDEPSWVSIQVGKLSTP